MTAITPLAAFGVSVDHAEAAAKRPLFQIVEIQYVVDHEHHALPQLAFAAVEGFNGQRQVPVDEGNLVDVVL